MGLAHNRPSPPVSSHERVLPLLADADNRRLLTEWVTDRYEVVTAEPASIHDAAFDLCIVDDQSLAAHRTALAERKEREAPAFLPYLLVTRSDDAETIASSVQEAVDDILTIPAAQAKLAWRVTNLLKQRHLSCELRRLKEESEERFRLLFQAAPDPIVVVSSDKLVSKANEAFYRTFGFDEGELDQVPFDDLGFWSPEAEEDTETDQTRPTLYWKRDGGKVLVMDFHINSVEVDQNVTEWVGIFRDITEYKTRVEELERERKRLEGLNWSRR